MIEPIKSLHEGDITRLPHEYKINGKQSLRPVISLLMYAQMPPTDEEFYEYVVGKLDAEGVSGEENIQSM